MGKAVLSLGSVIGTQDHDCPIRFWAERGEICRLRWGWMRGSLAGASNASAMTQRKEGSLKSVAEMGSERHSQRKRT